MTPQETDPDLPVSIQESTAEAWVGGGLLQSWGHLRALSVAVCTGENLKEVTINPTLELPELIQGWEIDSWRAQTEPCAPGPRRKEQ